MDEKKSKDRDWIQIGILLLLILTLTVNYLLFQRVNKVEAAMMEAVEAFNGTPTNVIPEDGLAQQTQAPAFSLETMDDRSLSLDQLIGSPTLLVFTATNCTACDRAYPILRELDRSMPELDVLVVMQGPESDIEAIQDQESLDLPVGIWSREISRDYRVSSTPFFTLIDRGGLVFSSGIFGTKQSMERILAKMN